MNPLNTFDRNDGTKISFKDYYETQYSLKIKDLRQPLIVSKSKARKVIELFIHMT